MKLLILTLCVACALADVSHIVQGSSSDAQITNQENDIGLEGNYKWGFQTSNGISSNAQGTLKSLPEGATAQVAQGDASWTDSNGEVVQIQYVADENGYQVQGSHIPTPPPIPEAILRALKYISEHPPPPEK